MLFRISEDKTSDYKKRVSVELTHSLFKHDAAAWEMVSERRPPLAARTLVPDALTVLDPLVFKVSYLRVLTLSDLCPLLTPPHRPTTCPGTDPIQMVSSCS